MMMPERKLPGKIEQLDMLARVIAEKGGEVNRLQLAIEANKQGLRRNFGLSEREVEDLVYGVRRRSWHQFFSPKILPTTARARLTLKKFSGEREKALRKNLFEIKRQQEKHAEKVSALKESVDDLKLVESQ